MTSSFPVSRLLPLTGASNKKYLLFGSQKAFITNSCTRLSFSSSSAMGSSHHWAHFPMGPPDPIVGLNEAFAKDVSPLKSFFFFFVFCFHEEEYDKFYLLNCVLC
jgi:hypothetical protein